MKRLLAIATALVMTLGLVAGVGAQDDPATGSITVIKIDQNTEEPLAGACFNLGSVNALMAAQDGANCTDETGTLVIDGLTLPGTYELVEESAPEGCQIGEMPGPIELTEAAPDASVTVLNACESEPTTGSITVTKVDQDGNPLAGACFNLGSINSLMAAQSGACTDESGVLVIDGLTVPGSYQLVEESAPEGCTTDDVPANIDLTAENPDQALTVTNDCATPTETATATATATQTATATETVTATATATQTSTVAVAQLPTTGSGDAGSGGGAIAALLAGAGVLLAAGAYLTRRTQRA